MGDVPGDEDEKDWEERQESRDAERNELLAESEISGGAKLQQKKAGRGFFPAGNAGHGTGKGCVSKGSGKEQEQVIISRVGIPEGEAIGPENVHPKCIMEQRAAAVLQHSRQLKWMMVARHSLRIALTSFSLNRSPL